MGRRCPLDDLSEKEGFACPCPTGEEDVATF